MPYKYMHSSHKNGSEPESFKEVIRNFENPHFEEIESDSEEEITI